MEWKWVSESGPSHDKIFVCSVHIGQMATMGSANSKKGAKTKAAEEMAKHLDRLRQMEAIGKSNF